MEQIKKLGTFRGVFLNNFLTIIGVIMYFRLTWIVGEVGIFGAVGIILLSKLITLTTGLSMSAITTNIKIGAGGAYSIINKSLGVETGGSIGIPLFLSQTLSIAMYIIGFSTAWTKIFPSHNITYVAIITTIIIIFLAYYSTDLAIKLQTVIMAIIILSIISYLITPSKFLPISQINLYSEPTKISFWEVYAIFFPAVTGILAGASLSGDLENPKKNIPNGTISSILITLLIYVGLAIFTGFIGTREQLISNKTFMIDNARFPILVLIGVMGATLSSAIGSILGAPRVLAAISQEKIIPKSSFFTKVNKNNIPTNATIFTGLLVLGAVIYGQLDSIATIVTMFFLITYGIINLVVFLQQSMNLITFRPTFKVSRFIPLLGFIASFTTMFLINIPFTLISIAIITFIYIYLLKQGFTSEQTDIRGGMLFDISKRFMKIAENYPQNQVTWMPEIYVPISKDISIKNIDLLTNITKPNGSLFLYNYLEVADTPHNNCSNYKIIQENMLKNGIYTHSANISGDFFASVNNTLELLSSFAFKPNTLYLELNENDKNQELIINTINETQKFNLGLILYIRKIKDFNKEINIKNINIWLRDKSPNKHLSILIGLQLFNNLEDGELNIISVASNKAERKSLTRTLNKIIDEARLPSKTNIITPVGSFNDSFNQVPNDAINIFGLAYDIKDLTPIFELSNKVNTPTLFIKDSGEENAFI